MTSEYSNVDSVAAAGGLSSAAEDYLKRLFLLQEKSNGETLRMKEVALDVGVSPSTVTSMMNTLKTAGMVDYEARHGCSLTKKGQKRAAQVLRRHRIIETFLVQVLGIDWAEVHLEAEQMEHSVSDLVINAMDKYLDHPGRDPHGAPIPGTNGFVQALSSFPLSQCEVGKEYRVVSISDEDAGFLRYLQQLGLMPGCHFSVKSRDEFAESIVIRCNANADTKETEMTYSFRAAEKIMVQ